MNPKLPKVTITIPEEKGPVDYECYMTIHLYQNKRTAIKLMHPEEGPMANATINLPDVPVIPENHIILKNCDENKGMAEAFQKAGIGRIADKGPYALLEVTHPAVLEAIEQLKKEVEIPKPASKKQVEHDIV
jgi:hypothetical protein